MLRKADGSPDQLVVAAPAQSRSSAIGVTEPEIRSQDEDRIARFFRDHAKAGLLRLEFAHMTVQEHPQQHRRDDDECQPLQGVDGHVLREVGDEEIGNPIDGDEPRRREQHVGRDHRADAELRPFQPMKKSLEHVGLWPIGRRVPDLARPQFAAAHAVRGDEVCHAELPG
jgi:hypothetical protein